jgi:hypothetical protein
MGAICNRIRAPVKVAAQHPAPALPYLAPRVLETGSYVGVVTGLAILPMSAAPVVRDRSFHLDAQATRLIKPKGVSQI